MSKEHIASPAFVESRSTDDPYSLISDLKYGPILNEKIPEEASSKIQFVKSAVIPSILLGITLSIFSALFFALRDYLIILADAKYLIFASFGSTAFIMYLMPKSPSAKISKFAKSYVAASLIGYAGLYIAGYLGIFAAIAIVETFIAITMVALKAEHPPAAAIGLVFTINRVGAAGILLIIIGILTISGLTMVLKKTVHVAEHEESEIRSRKKSKL